MKFLVVGLGSMGKRRIRNLQYLKAGEILGFDLRADRRQETEEKYGIKTYADFDKAMGENPDALIVSTPPGKHTEYCMAAARADKHFFAEEDVSSEGMDELIGLCRSKDIVAAPSCSMRFHPAVRTLKDLVDSRAIGEVLAFTYHSGQYLPDWHTYEDYRAYYVSQRETGACREIVPFELEWITWTLGEIKKIFCMKSKLSSLQADIDDVYQLILEFQSGVLGSMLVDVISRFPYRVLKLLSEEGVIVWDWSTRSIELFSAHNREWKEYSIDEGTPEKGYVWGEKMYIDEMAHFIRAIKGEEQYIASFEEYKRVLELLYAAELSAESGRQVIL